MPTIFGAVYFIISLEGKIKRLEEKIDTKVKDINEIKRETKNDIEKLTKENEKTNDKMDRLITKLSDNIQMLTTASVKHDLQLELINKNIESIRHRFDTVIKSLPIKEGNTGDENKC